MALDLADERRSAGRAIPPELWLCLGTHGGERALAALENELAGGGSTAEAGAARLERRAAALGLARAGRRERLAELAEVESDPEVAATMRGALAGPVDSRAFAPLHPESS